MNFVLVSNARDGAALAAALTFGDTVALTVGDDAADPWSRAAKARGCARALRIWDDALRGLDYLAVAQVIQRTVRMVRGDDLQHVRVFAGDRGRAAVGPAVADRLGLASLTHVQRVTRDGERVIATRADDERYVVPAAALLAILPDSAHDLRADERGDVERVTLGDIGLLAGELAHRRRFALTLLDEKAAN